MIPIEDYCRQLINDNPDITPAEMMHYLHLAGYGREETIQKVKFFFEELGVEEMCRIIINEYNKPLIDKAELKRLLLLCAYNEEAVGEAIELYYPISLGFVMMLDDSYSMNLAKAMIKIDAKAFIRCARTGDSFGINKFGKEAEWLYPTGNSPSPVIVTESAAEISEAEEAIETLSAEGSWTNIGAAVSLGNQMIEKTTTGLKAFLLISDGEKNIGPDPASVLGTEPPIFIAGLGPHMHENYFKEMLDKNPERSRFYNSPTYNDMMTVFNDMIADSTQSILTLNNLSSYKKGSDAIIREFNVVGEGNSTLVNVVWSDKKYCYTSGYPASTQINVILIGPDGKSTDIRPEVSEEGFCIFRLHNVKPGRWKVLEQYSLDEPIKGTAGSIAFGTGLHLDTFMPISASLGGTITARLTASAKCAVSLKNLLVDARVGRPTVSIKNVLEHYADRLYTTEAGEIDGKALHQLREELIKQEGRDIFEHQYTSHTFRKESDREFKCNIEVGPESGICTAHLKISGTDASTGMPFTCYKTHSVLVE